jgi:MFS family permease
MASISVSPDAGEPRRAGLVQGALAMLMACLPLVALMGLPPAMPKLLAHFSGTPGAAVLTPLVATAPGACVALLAPAAGLLADRIGRRKTALAALALFIVSGLAPLVLDGLWLILASRLVLGVANAALLTIGTTLIGDYFEGETRRRWLAINGVAGSLLISLAMLAGGVLAERGWRGPFLLDLLAVPVFVLALFQLFEPAQHHHPAPETASLAGPFPWRSLGVLAATTLAGSVLFYAEAVQIGLVLDAAGLRSSSLIAAIGAAASIGYPLGSVVFCRLARTWPPAAMSTMAWLLIGAGLVGLGALPDYRAIGLCAFVQQVGGGVLITLLIHQCYERFPFRYRARSMGVWAAFFFAGQFASPLLVSAAGAPLGGLRPAISALGVFALLLAALVAAAFRPSRLRPATAEAA